MSSNNPTGNGTMNNSDMNALLAVLRQQLGQGNGGGASSSPAVPNPARAAAPSNNTVNFHGSATLLAQAAAPQTNGEQIVPDNDSARQQQMTSLLQSAKLLAFASINPALAAAAMEQAFASIAQMSTPSAPPLNGGHPQDGAAVSNHQSMSSGISSITYSAPVQSVATTSLRSKVNPSEGPSKSMNGGLQSKRSANGNAKVTFSSEGNSSASLPIKLGPSVNEAIAFSSRSLDGATANELRSPPSPVGLPVLQTWDLPQLESYAQRFKGCNLPVPSAVRVVIEEIQRKENKLLRKRIANRKTAAASRSRKLQLIDDLIASNAELRRQVLVLSYIPDACMAIDVTGKITFCSPQVQRILGYKVEEMEGANIEQLLVPGSRSKFNSIIRDLVSAVTMSTEGKYNFFDYSGSGDSSDANAISQSSERFPLLEVQVDGDDDDDENGSNDISSEHSSERDGNKNAEKKSSTTTMSSLTPKSLISSNDNISTEESNEPPKKKLKASIVKKESSTSSSEAMNVDDVMGASVTKNNADAKLSSLMHPRTNNNASEDSKGSTATTNETITQIKHQQPSLRRHTQRTSNPPENQKDSLDSGYRNSSEGSEDNSD